MNAALQWIEALGQRVVLGNTVYNLLLASLLVISTVAAVRLTRRLLSRVARRVTALTPTDLDEAIAELVVGPVAALAALPLLQLALATVRVPGAVRRIADNGLVLGFDVILLIICWRVTDLLFRRSIRRLQATGEPDARTGLLSFASKIAKGLILLVFAIAGLRSVGFDVFSLLTGLGVGGLAVALAAQETLGNVLGSAQILTDRPFVQGDFIRAGGISGRVAAIGMRSTKVVAANGVRVMLPNKQLAEQPIENLSVVHGLTVAADIGLVYGTSAEQLDHARGLLIEIVRAVPGTHEDVRAHFLRFGAYSLDLRLCYFITDFARQLDIRNEVNLAIKRRFDAEGLDFAFPTQSLHVASLPAAPPADAPR